MSAAATGPAGAMRQEARPHRVRIVKVFIVMLGSTPDAPNRTETPAEAQARGHLWEMDIDQSMSPEPEPPAPCSKLPVKRASKSGAERLLELEPQTSRSELLFLPGNVPG